MLITLEGIEGSGKSTQIPRLVAYLERLGHTCVVTREPGGTQVGRQIRAILLAPENAGMEAMAELMLYEADRAQHVRQVIRPALCCGRIVICDRSCDSTVAYQAAARGIAPEIVEELNERVMDGLVPDVTFLLDLPARVGLTRAWKQIASGGRHENETRFEMETIGFHEKVRKGYLTLAEKHSDRIRVIDAEADPEQVRRAMIRELEFQLTRIQQL